MQLNRIRSVRDALTAATCALLSIDPAQAGFFDSDRLWIVDSAVLFYGEQDRVNVIEPVVQVKTEFSEGEFVTLKLVYDAMSGATPNGATPTDSAQTFTSPSGETVYTTAANALPLVSFRDTRVALSGDWERPINRSLRGQYSAYVSGETDYLSVGASASFLWDVNNKLTTLTLGVAANADQIKPTGGAPVELAPVAPRTTAGVGNRALEGVEIEAEDDGGGDGPTQSKTGYDVLVGVTQVVTRRTLMQFNYGYGVSSGYLTDPYKIVSILNPTTGATTGYVHEKRPDSRVRNTLYWKTVYHLPEDVINVSYRYFWDNWDVQAHTLDLTYRLDLGKKTYVEPHFRYYTQTAADFFNHGIESGTTPRYASSDLRLAEMQSNTLGLRFARTESENSEWGVGVDYMVQTGNAHPGDAIGLQTTQNLFSELKALSVTADFSIKF